MIPGLRRALRAKWVLVALAIVAASFAKISDASAQITTLKGNVEADVSNGPFGLLTIFYFDGAGNKQHLSYNDFSYLTVEVNGVFYTNNSNISSGTDWETNQMVNLVLLNGGNTKKIGDTIETVWPIGTNGFDIIQDVYPVAAKYNTPSAVIVYKFSIRNHQPSFLPAQAQFLLDIETSPNPSPDDPKITTREGYNENAGQDFWHNFTTLPPYFITSDFDICTKDFPGQLGIGYTVDSLAPDSMGLMQPSLMANVDLKQYVSSYAWGFPTQLSGTPMSNDDAMLFQWQSSGVGPAPTGGTATQVIGMGCYGTPPCQIAFGNLDATLLHIEHIRWSVPPSGIGQYVPNHFPVEAIVWNSNQSSSASSATGTQAISNQSGSGLPGPVQIVSPLPTTNNGYSQKHGFTSGGATRPDSMVLACSASHITWEDTLIEGKLINCSTDSTYDITLAVSAAGVPNPIFLNGSQSTACPIVVDCEEKDVTPPRHSTHIGSQVDSCGNFVLYTDSVFDNRPTDLGIQSITYTEAPPNSVTVTIPSISNCPSVIAPITMLQKNLLFNDVVYFTFTDCAGNVSYDTVSFTKCVPPVPFDTLPPKFRTISKYDWSDTNTSCGFRCSDWMVTDTVKDGLQQDSGLLSIAEVPGANTYNMTFTLPQPVVKGEARDSFTVCVIDSMFDGSDVIEAKDVAGNISYDTITYCTQPDTLKPHIQVSSFLPGFQYEVTAEDTRAWDRGLKQVLLSRELGQPFNVRPIPAPGIILDSLDSTTWVITPDTNHTCPATLNFYVAVIDSFESACFTVRATDCENNVSDTVLQCYSALTDHYCPTIDTVTLPSGELSVTVSDVHLAAGDTIGYDEGVDSIWFTCAHNMTLVVDSGSTDPAGSIWQSQDGPPGTLHALHGIPSGGDHPRFAKTITFKLFVTDTLSQDGQEPCVCINAIDGAKNVDCNGTYQWCSSIAQDHNPPVVTVSTPSCETLGVLATDSKQYDRGVHRIWLDSITNFVPVNDSSFSGDSVVPLVLQIPDSNASAYALLSSIDVYGANSPIPSQATQHTTSADVWIYKQDLHMNGTGIVQASTNFSVPVLLAQTDSVPLAQKNITRFRFVIDLTGSPLVTYTGAALSLALQGSGWALDPNPLTSPYVISGFGPKLTNLESTDTLVILHFSAMASTDVEETRIAIVTDPCGAGVVYNGGNDTTIASANFSATLPAPSGRLNGGSIILKDTCSTIVGDHPNPTFLSIAPVSPNPVTSSAMVQYTVPAEAPVTLDLYDELGRKVRTLVAADEKQGTYQIELNTSGLPAGIYHLLLASQGSECSQWVLVP